MLSWIDGDDTEEILPLLPGTEQCVLGMKAGRILNEMQTIEAFPPSNLQYKSIKVEKL